MTVKLKRLKRSPGQWLDSEKAVQTHLGVEVGGVGQAAVAAFGSLFAAAKRNTLVFCFFEPICIFPV